MNLTREVVTGMTGVVELAVVPAGAVAPDHAAGFLEPSIGIDQLGAGKSRPGLISEGSFQGLEPAGCDHRVIVEEDKKATTRHARAAVARANETEVLLVPDRDQAFDCARRARA